MASFQHIRDRIDRQIVDHQAQIDALFALKDAINGAEQDYLRQAAELGRTQAQRRDETERQLAQNRTAILTDRTPANGAAGSI